MKKTKAPLTTLSTNTAAKTENVSGDKNEIRTLFFGAALDMTWQMAVVVLVPIIGGFELDKYFHTTPILIIIGFVLAVAGTFMVIKRTLNVYGDRALGGPKEHK